MPFASSDIPSTPFPPQPTKRAPSHTAGIGLNATSSGAFPDHPLKQIPPVTLHPFIFSFECLSLYDLYLLIYFLVYCLSSQKSHEGKDLVHVIHTL